MSTSLTDAMRESIKKQLTAVPRTKTTTKQRLNSAGLWVRPFASEALGVHPDQIPEATEALRKQGVTADFDSEGRLLITSDAQYRKAAKAAGLWDGARGYGHQDADGNRVLSGREQERAKEQFRQAVARGDYD